MNKIRKQAAPEVATPNALRDAIQKSIDSGDPTDPTPLNMDEILSKARQRFNKVND